MFEASLALPFYWSLEAVKVRKHSSEEHAGRTFASSKISARSEPILKSVTQSSMAKWFEFNASERDRSSVDENLDHCRAK